MNLVLIVLLVILILLYIYTVIKGREDADLEVLQRTYTIYLLEAICESRGINVDDIDNKFREEFGNNRN